MKIALFVFLVALFVQDSFQRCNVTEDKVFILHGEYQIPVKIMPVTLCNATAVIKDQPIRMNDYEDYLKIEGAYLRSENKEKLPILYSGTFSFMPELKTLILSMVEMKEIQPGAFKNLDKLKYLNLKRNQLKTLPPHLFDDVPELKMLNLEDNRLETIDEHLFDKLTNLKHLWLNMNEIKDLMGHWHTGLSNLNYLNLAANQLDVLRSEMFHGLTNLDRLRLHTNRISELQKDAFKGLIKLDSLTMEFNAIIDGDLRHELQNLPKLSGISLTPYNFYCEMYMPAFEYLSEKEVEIVEIPYTSKCLKRS